MLPVSHTYVYGTPHNSKNISQKIKKNSLCVKSISRKILKNYIVAKIKNKVLDQSGLNILLILEFVFYTSKYYLIFFMVYERDFFATFDNEISTKNPTVLFCIN